jgi:signal transduction histidine kinase
MSVSKKQGLGKYRVIVIAVALFLVFDLGVLILNFFTSYQIGQDAISINLAGRQRMLSQRMTKSLLIIANDASAGRDIGAGKTELKKTVGLFDSTLKAFHTGGSVMGGNDKMVELNAITSPKGLQILREASTIWQGYTLATQPIITQAEFTPEQLTTAITYARANNIKLLGLMNGLTNDLEKIASAKAERLRLVQTIGIGLALLNFGFILFKFIRSLRRSDELVEQAQQETDEILATVKEGLFLLDENLKIGNQYSASLRTILLQEIKPGADFIAILGSMSSSETLVSARDYIELLFGNHVKENLIISLNPLSEVEVQLTDSRGKSDTRYLSFQFNRVLVADRISHLLVTVQDVTERVHLVTALADVKGQSKVELSYLQKILAIDHEQMHNFLALMETSLTNINAALQQASEHGGADYHSIINKILRETHTIKGEAATLGLESCTSNTHSFEQEMIRIRNLPHIQGNDMVGLTVRLDDFFERLHLVRTIMSSVTGSNVSTLTPVAHASNLVDDMQLLCLSIASDQQKQAKLTADLAALPKLPECLTKELRNITIQLLRNAVSHGIETPDERILLGKSPTGSIHLSCKEIQKDQFEWVIRDDGHGLDPERIKSALLRNNYYDQEALTSMDTRSIVMKIFDPGFSTLTTAHANAGHGIGLDLILDKINAIGGRLHVKTRVNHSTEFIIHFALGRSPMAQLS